MLVYLVLAWGSILHYYLMSRHWQKQWQYIHLAWPFCYLKKGNGYMLHIQLLNRITFGLCSFNVPQLHKLELVSLTGFSTDSGTLLFPSKFDFKIFFELWYWFKSPEYTKLPWGLMGGTWGGCGGFEISWFLVLKRFLTSTKTFIHF